MRKRIVGIECRGCWAVFFALAALAAGLGFAVSGGAAASPRRVVRASRAAAESDVTRATLKNGLRVVLVRDRLAPVVTTMVNYKVGSDEAPAGFPGMAHAQEHMMFRGSPGLSAGQLADIIAAMGGQFNADTQDTVTQYFLVVPSEDVDVALHIESIRMRGADNSEAEWSKERGAIEQEVASDNSNPGYKFFSRVLKLLFRGTPYAHDALGTRPSFDKTTGAMLRSFYNTWYAPNNAILVVAGNIEPQAVLAEIHQLFDAIPAKKLPPRPAVKLQPVVSQAIQLPTDQPYGMAAVAFRMPGSASPDFAAANILGDVLSSQRGSLYALVPAGKALFAGFEFQPFPEAGLGVAVAYFPKGADSAALLDQVKDVLRQDLKNGLPADLVEAAKRREESQAEFQKNSIFGLASEWSEAVAVEGRQSPEDDIEAIRKVTVEDVNRVARKYLLLDRTVTAVLTPQPSGKPMAHPPAGGPESFTPSNPKPVPLPAWAEAAVSRLEVPPSTIHPVTTTLPNGLKLIVQPETVSATVSVYGEVRNNPNLETPPHQEGVASILNDLFPYGTASLDRVAFQRALDAIAANESAGTNFHVTMLAQHFDRGVELLADNLLHPALPEPAFGIVQRQTAAAIAGRLESPGYLAGRATDAALFPQGDPALRQATPKSAMSLTLGDVRQYYSRVFRPDLTTIVVVGEVTPAAAQAVIAKYFGSWKNDGPKPEVDPPQVPPSKGSVATVPDSSRVQDSVTLAETIPITRFSSAYYALELGNHVLGGGFYASRLYKDLREKAGLVYFVSNSLNAGRTRTTYMVNYGCDPPNVSKARALVLRDLRQMQTLPVDSASLRQAKILLLREIPLGESSVGSIAMGLLNRATTGLPLDEPTLAARRYLALTAVDVEAAFAKWVRPGDFAQVVQGPNPQ